MEAPYYIKAISKPAEPDQFLSPNLGSDLTIRPLISRFL